VTDWRPPQALISAKTNADLYPGIEDAVTAILFLATPHRGSNAAVYGNILGLIANALLATRFTGKMRTDLLQSLKSKAYDLQVINEDFRSQTSRIKITSFIEQDTMKGMKERVNIVQPSKRRLI
jgi:hypothetical protein